jgi:hypothetical protein
MGDSTPRSLSGRKRAWTSFSGRRIGGGPDRSARFRDERRGRLDLLVNNAGWLERAAGHTDATEESRQLIATNLKGPY